MTRLVGSFVAARIEPVALVIALTVLATLFRALLRAREKWPYLLISSLLMVTLAQAVVYRGPIFEHYLAPVAPLLYLALAASFAMLWSQRTLHVLAAGAAVVLVGLNLRASPLLEEPQHQLARTRAVSQAIAEASAGQPFAVWLLAAADSDAAYRFWLERDFHPPVEPHDPLPRQLFVICDLPACELERVRASIGPDWSQSHVASELHVATTRVIHLTEP